jgi:hypothetical protein
MMLLELRPLLHLLRAVEYLDEAVIWLKEEKRINGSECKGDFVSVLYIFDGVFVDLTRLLLLMIPF